MWQLLMVVVVVVVRMEVIVIAVVVQREVMSLKTCEAGLPGWWPIGWWHVLLRWNSWWRRRFGGNSEHWRLVLVDLLMMILTQ